MGSALIVALRNAGRQLRGATLQTELFSQLVRATSSFAEVSTLAAWIGQWMLFGEAEPQDCLSVCSKFPSPLRLHWMASCMNVASTRKQRSCRNELVRDHSSAVWRQCRMAAQHSPALPKAWHTWRHVCLTLRYSWQFSCSTCASRSQSQWLIFPNCVTIEIATFRVSARRPSVDTRG